MTDAVCLSRALKDGLGHFQGIARGCEKGRGFD